MHGEPQVCVVGAGLAGCEAAWQAARLGARVRLIEMKPLRTSPAHQSDELAELVCSNSLRGASLGVAVGLLKEEMRRLGSLILSVADETAVPAGRALAVDRLTFSRRVTERIAEHPRISLHHEVVTRLPDHRPTVLATGPLTDDELAAELQQLVGESSLYFYDAISPIVYADSVDHEVAFRASRWEDGPGDYLNLPLDRSAYERFVAELVAADAVPLHRFERRLYFEGCLPIEEMARRGPRTLAFGPMKPVGLRDPRTGRTPHAVVQLRQEDKQGVLYNLVGFQTRLRIGEQKRILRGLPGMQDAVFARMGSVHRNTYLNAPRHLLPSLELRERPGTFVAGQMAGVEGYVESAAVGFMAGIQAACQARGEPAPEPHADTAHAALLRHLREGGAGDFQPTNVTYGLFPRLADDPVGGKRGGRPRKRERHERMAARALDAIGAYAEACRGLEAP